MREEVRTDLIANAAISAVVNLLVIAGLPFLLCFAYQKGRQKRGFAELAQRAGLRLGPGRYFGYSLAFALAGVAISLFDHQLWAPSFEMGLHNKRFEASASPDPLF